MKVQNEDLCHRLRRAESFLSRVKEELAHYRACNGRSPYVHLDEEQILKNKVKVSFVKLVKIFAEVVGNHKRGESGCSVCLMLKFSFDRSVNRKSYI